MAIGPLRTWTTSAWSPRSSKKRWSLATKSSPVRSLKSAKVMTTFLAEGAPKAAGASRTARERNRQTFNIDIRSSLFIPLAKAPVHGIGRRLHEAIQENFIHSEAGRELARLFFLLDHQLKPRLIHHAIPRNPLEHVVFPFPQGAIHILVQLVTGLLNDFHGLAVALIHKAVRADQSAQQSGETLRLMAHNISGGRGDPHRIAARIDLG